MTATHETIGTFSITATIRAEIAWAPLAPGADRRRYAARLIIDGTEQAWLGTYTYERQAQDAAYDAAEAIADPTGAARQAAQDEIAARIAAQEAADANYLRHGIARS